MGLHVSRSEEETSKAVERPRIHGEISRFPFTGSEDIARHNSGLLCVSQDEISRVVTLHTSGTGGAPKAGTYQPQRLEKSWFSRKYDMSPMPHAIFFHGGYAIHGTYYVSRLGRRASHGCVRLSPANAATLFSLVQKKGNGSTRIVVVR